MRRHVRVADRRRVRAPGGTGGPGVLSGPHRVCLLYTSRCV
ncbi:hypothetical protein [Streptomyces fragilis]|nr:hypothetical protein [Streptomyces fragilis]